MKGTITDAMFSGIAVIYPSEAGSGGSSRVTMKYIAGVPTLLTEVFYMTTEELAAGFRETGRRLQLLKERL